MSKLSAMGAALLLSSSMGSSVERHAPDVTLAAGNVRAAVVPTMGAHTSALQPAPIYEYVGKFICGPQADSSSMAIVRGFYATTVNARNQGPTIAHIRKQALWTLVPGNEKAVDPLPTVLRDSLRPGQGLAAECKEFLANTKTEMGTSVLHEGLIVITSDTPLDVIGVYTVGAPILVGRQWTSRQVATMEIDRFPSRRVPAT